MNEKSSHPPVSSWNLPSVWMRASLLVLSLAPASPGFAQSGADTTAPSVTSFELDTGSVTPTTARMLITFSESVTGVDGNDFALNTTPNATASITGVTAGPTPASFYVTFNYTGTSGSLQMAIKSTGTGIADTAANAFAGRGVAATGVYPVNNVPPTDVTPPSVTSFSAPNAVTASPANLALVFSETVTGVSADDFIASPGATIGTVTGSGTTWTVPVQFSGTAPVSVTLRGGATANIRDAGTHWFAGGPANTTVTFTPGSSTPSGAPVITSPLTATVVAGAPFSYTIVASNSPLTLTATTLPNGLTFSSPTISGAVTIPGTYNIVLGATNAAGADTKTLVLTVTPASASGTQVVGVTPPPAGTYSAGQTLSFKVTFNNPVTVIPTSGALEARPHVTWTGGGSNAPQSSGRFVYASGSGSSVLTFSYTVQPGDSAQGITLGSVIGLPTGASVRDASGTPLAAGALTLPWTSPTFSGIVFGSTGSGSGHGPVTVLKRGDGLVAGQPFALPTTNASGQPITWVLVSGNATLVGNILTPKNRGAVVVRAVPSTPGAGGSSGSAEFEFEADDKKGGPKAAHRNRLGNLSSRLRVTPNNARPAIAGFVVTGTSTKQVLVRAVGPGLSSFGVANAVTGARVQLFDTSGRMISQNEGWNGDASVAAAAERVGAFQLNPGSRDAALLVTLSPGAYTAQVGSASDGIALLEVYDASGDAVSTEQLINISTRGFVDTGDGKLIAGFVVTGDAPKRILVRGIGAALSAFGVAGVLADPVLELFTGGGVLLARNDNWEAPQAIGLGPVATATDVSLAANAAGAFPLPAGSRDAATVITLMPGSYSAVVGGAGNATGAGLVEVYEVGSN